MKQIYSAPEIAVENLVTEDIMIISNVHDSGSLTTIEWSTLQ